MDVLSPKTDMFAKKNLQTFIETYNIISKQKRITQIIFECLV